MCHVICLSAMILKCDENALVEISRRNSNACASKIRRDLVKATAKHPFLRTTDEIGGYRGMMGRLFGDVGYSDG